MASSAVCAFCLNPDGIQDPRALPCLHIYCMECIKHYYSFNKVIRCPQCRETYKISPSNLLPADQAMRVDKSHLCDTCIKMDTDTESAVTFCSECSELLCTTHQLSHDDLHKEHSRIDIGVYKNKGRAFEKRLCDIHRALEYSLGCRSCLIFMCSKCVEDSTTCIGGSTHQLLTLDDLVKKLTLLNKMEEREEKYFDFMKTMYNIISDFDTETECLLETLHKQRDEQLEAIRLKYVELERSLLERREKVKTEMTMFTEETLAAKLSDFCISKQKIETQMMGHHPMDIVKRCTEIKEEIQSFLSCEIPQFEFNGVLTIETKVIESSREVEVKVSQGVIRLSSDLGQAIIPAPPRSLSRTHTTYIPSECIAVSQYQGITYVGSDKACVYKICEHCKQSKLFIEHRPREFVSGLVVDNDRVYTLLYNAGYKSCVSVYNMAGELITSWPHSDVSDNGNNRYYYNKLAIVDNQVIVPDRGNKILTVYSLSGEVQKVIPCLLLSNNCSTSICSAGSCSVVISDRITSQVFRVDVNTGETIWVSKLDKEPLAVAVYCDEYVMTTFTTEVTTVLILSFQTGKLLGKLEDSSLNTYSSLCHMHVSGDVLTFLSKDKMKVLHYQIR